ncbi:hypothetical protein CANCADRAFT_1031 [Tortispora caseinolytica NRRL Y-17796]|uniref:Defect at low temperature protein 1 n=1 Tax=Tortispora caseinolytica NRRL Y-17796 TaxID=767744 RepID=A0A1E4TL08_9ASCO|nr:hypothetical protein CANCADRAFT_1031 [Tortispora caseinolytica NRRL Y-17796]
MHRLFSKDAFERFLYRFSLYFLVIFIIAFLIVTPADAVTQSLRNGQVYNGLIMAAAYIAVIVLSLFIYLSRLIQAHRDLAEIPKYYMPITQDYDAEQAKANRKKYNIVYQGLAIIARLALVERRTDDNGTPLSMRKIISANLKKSLEIKRAAIASIDLKSVKHPGLSSGTPLTIPVQSSTATSITANSLTSPSKDLLLTPATSRLEPDTSRVMQLGPLLQTISSNQGLSPGLSRVASQIPSLLLQDPLSFDEPTVSRCNTSTSLKTTNMLYPPSIPESVELHTESTASSPRKKLRRRRFNIFQHNKSDKNLSASNTNSNSAAASVHADATNTLNTPVQTISLPANIGFNEMVGQISHIIGNWTFSLNGVDAPPTYHVEIEKREYRNEILERLKELRAARKSTLGTGNASSVDSVSSFESTRIKHARSPNSLRSSSRSDSPPNVYGMDGATPEGGLRGYLDYLQSMNVIQDSPLPNQGGSKLQRFLELYERSRFSETDLTEEEFIEIMSLFLSIMHDIQTQFA